MLYGGACGEWEEKRMNRVEKGVKVMKLSVADTFTILNALSGFLGITYVLDGKYHIAALFLFASVLFDGLDGISYRRFGSRHTSGDKLDSIADSISFVIFPAIFLYSAYYDPARGVALTSLENASALLAAFAILFSGLYHLGLFVAHGPDTFFPGQPTPLVSIIVIESIFLLQPAFTEVIALALAVSMIAPIQVPKVKGRKYMAVFLILLLSSSYFVLYILGINAPVLLWTGFAATAVYAVGSSMLPLFRHRLPEN